MFGRKSVIIAFLFVVLLSIPLIFFFLSPDRRIVFLNNSSYFSFEKKNVSAFANVTNDWGIWKKELYFADENRKVRIKNLVIETTDKPQQFSTDMYKNSELITEDLITSSAIFDNKNNLVIRFNIKKKTFSLFSKQEIDSVLMDHVLSTLYNASHYSQQGQKQKGEISYLDALKVLSQERYFPFAIKFGEKEII